MGTGRISPRRLIRLTVLVAAGLYTVGYLCSTLKMVGRAYLAAYKFPVLNYRHLRMLDHFDPAPTAKQYEALVIPPIMHHMSADEHIPAYWTYPYESCVLNAHHRKEFQFMLWYEHHDFLRSCHHLYALSLGLTPRSESLLSHIIRGLSAHLTRIDTTFRELTPADTSFCITLVECISIVMLDVGPRLDSFAIRDTKPCFLSLRLSEFRMM
jgi:hypothetical protein